MDLGVFLFHGQVELVVAGGGVGFVGRVAEDVLAAEFLVEVRVDFVECFFFGDLEETPAGGFRKLLEDFLAVGARFFGAAGIAASPSAAHPTAAHVRAAVPAASTVAFFLVGEKNAIDEGVGALRGFEGFGERFLAAAIDAVGEDYQGFAARLLFHEFIGREVDGIIEESPAAVAVTVRAAAAAIAPATAAGGTGAGTGLGELRRVDLIDGGQEFLTGGGEVLEEFHFVIEMDEEGLVFVFAENVVEEGAAGGTLLIEDAALAEAGVDEEAEGEREVGLLGEIGDSLGLAVLLESEIVFREIANDGAVFIANGGEEIDGGDVDGDGRGLLAEQRQSG